MASEEEARLAAAAAEGIIAKAARDAFPEAEQLAAHDAAATAAQDLSKQTAQAIIPNAQGAARTPAQIAADAAATAGKASGATAQFEVDGRTFVDVSGSSTPLAPEVKAALDSVPMELRPKWHGGCAEPRCVSKALRARLDPSKGVMGAVQIGDNGRVPHGALKPPCPSCQVLRKVFGYKQ